MKKLIVIVLIVGCSQAMKTPRTWQGTMSKLSQTLSTVVPFIFNSTYKGEDAKTVGENIQKFATLVKDVEGRHPVLREDPAYYQIAEKLKYDTEMASQYYRKGDRSGAQSLLKGSINYCIQCHTRGDDGPQYFRKEFGPLLSETDDVDKGHFLAATRQFDLALDAYDHALISGKLNKDEWKLAAMNVLAITVRLKRDPFLGLEAISRLFDKKSVPASMKGQVLNWRQSFKDWSEDKRVLTTQQKLKLAESIVFKAKRNSESQLVDFLRAWTLLDESMDKVFDDDRYKARFLMAKATEYLYNIGFFEDPEFYYRDCLNLERHASWTSRCELAYRDFLLQEYGVD